jgi:hypothetical protein
LDLAAPALEPARTSSAAAPDRAPQPPAGPGAGERRQPAVLSAALRARSPARLPSASLLAGCRILSGAALVLGSILVVVGTLQLLWISELTRPAVLRFAGSPLIQQGVRETPSSALGSWSKLLLGCICLAGGFGVRDYRSWARIAMSATPLVVLIYGALHPPLPLLVGLLLGALTVYAFWLPAGAQLYRMGPPRPPQKIG